MPSSGRPISLHKATNLKDLNSMVEKVTNTSQIPLENRLKSFDNLLKEGKSYVRKGDEENAYLMFMRALNLFEQGKFSKEFTSNSNGYKVAFGNKPLTCLQECENLSSSLSRRYKLLEESRIRKEQEILKGPKEDNSENDSEVNDDLTNSSIDSESLFDLIEKTRKSEHEFLLLLDTRNEKDFNDSHIQSKNFSNSVVIVNIPEELLFSGVTLIKLFKSLPIEAVNALKTRRFAKYVVYFDWNSTSINESESLKSLYFALWKWDPKTERITSKPILLKSGYEGWLLHFPTLTTNSKAIPPSKLIKTNEYLKIDNFYSQLGNFDAEQEEKAKDEDVPKEETKDESNNQVNKITPAYDFHLRFGQVKLDKKIAPGCAQRVPDVDRTIKPNSLNNDTVPKKNISSNNIRTSLVNETEAEFKARKQKEAGDILEMYRKEEEQKQNEKLLEKISADIERLRLENVELKRSLKPDYNKASVNLSNDKNDSQISNTNDESSTLSNNKCEPHIYHQKSTNETIRQTELTVSESTALHPLSKSLSSANKNSALYHSYPNIYEFCEDSAREEEASKLSSSVPRPSFDRALKPSNLLQDFRTTPAKLRNFSPVYGTGQTNTGLKNLGNTCFMNSLIQCLADTTDFREYFAQEKYLNVINRDSKLGSKGELAEEFALLMKRIRGNHYKYFSPSDFKTAVGIHMPFFVGCDQQDAHEFFCMLLEKLHADLNRAPQNVNTNHIIPSDVPAAIAINKFWKIHESQNLSIVSKLFEGLLMSTLKCTYCEMHSNTFETFTNLSLPIPAVTGSRCTLFDCFKLFSDQENLKGEAAWECPRCKCKRESTKKISVCRLPQVLVIHLKRFSYEGLWRQKLQTFVEFPLSDLSLKNYRYINAPDSKEPILYDLHGVVNHYGTLEGGHYISFCKDDKKEKWYKYDDHEVTEISAADVKTHSAYILFYSSKKSKY